MYKIFFLAGIAALLLSCKKENNSIPKEKPAVELLTHKPWILASHGFDENRDEEIDPSREIIEDCQKDNTWYFKPDGTGLFDEGFLSCATGIDRETYTWKFINNETAIDFFYDAFKILRLNEDQLILSKEFVLSEGDTTKYLIVLRH